MQQPPSPPGRRPVPLILGALLALGLGFFVVVLRFHPQRMFVPTDEFLVLFIFLLAVVGVYVLAAGFLVRRVRRALRSDRRQPGPAAVRTERVVFVLACLGFACMGWGWLAEPYWPEVTHTRVATRKLPTGSRPVRIAHISDLHCEAAPRLEERLPDLIAAEAPDLIAFTGDSLNEEAGLPTLKACLSRFAKIAPTFVVKGNWDVWHWDHLDRFGGTGVRELDGDAVRVETKGGSTVWIAGVPIGGEAKAGAALAKIPPEAFGVFLCHYPNPEVVPPEMEHRADLFLAGHTHGGQVALPWYGAIITLARHGKKYERGLYDLGGRWMYVTRGIGMEGGLAPRVRFCARPEIAMIEVGPGKN